MSRRTREREAVELASEDKLAIANLQSRLLRFVAEDLEAGRGEYSDENTGHSLARRLKAFGIQIHSETLKAKLRAIYSGLWTLAVIRADRRRTAPTIKRGFDA